MTIKETRIIVIADMLEAGALYNDYNSLITVGMNFNRTALGQAPPLPIVGNLMDIRQMK